MQITQSSSYSRLAFALLAGVITLAGIICLHRSPATVVEPVPTKSGEQPVQRAASPATAKKPENTAEQEDRVVFRDEFQRDSRDQYKITGPVEWEKGKLTLAAGASLEKKISTVPKLDIAFQTVWPPLEKEGDTSRLEITVWNAGSNSIVAVFERCRKEGRNAAELAIVQRTANPRPGQGLRAEPEDTMVRRFSTASDFSSGMIRIHFVFGLLSVTADGEELATGFVRVSGQENQSMVLHSARLGCRVVQIAIEGDRPRRLTENEKRSAELALRTSQEANWFYARGNYPRAELLARQAVEIKKKVLGENHPDYAVSLGDLAAMLHAQGDYARAKPVYRQAVEIGKKVLGENHPDYARILNNFAELYRSQGDYARAEPVYRQAMETWKKVLGENNPDYAISLNNLALLHQAQGDYAQAEALLRKAVEIGKKALGEKHPDYAGSLNNLAELYRSQGEYARAEPLYRQAMGIIREALGENHPGYAVSLGNLALLYQAQGDYARAEPLYRQAMVIEKKLFGENHPAYARSLNNLASLYSARRDYARAEPLLRQAMEIGKNALGDKHPDYAVSLNNLAFLYLLQDDYARAEPLFRQAMEITKQALGENHPDYATGLNNLASLHRVRGDYARAGPLYRKALEITKQALGENHPDYAESLHNLAILCFAQGDAARAVSAERQAVSIERGNLEVTAVVQSERQQLAKLKSVRVYLDMYLALTAGQDQFSVPAYQEMLAWKGAVFRRERLVRAGEQTPELAAAFQKLQRVTAQFAKQAWATPDPKQAAHWRENVEQLSAEKERLEAELSARSAAFRQARKQSTLEELQQALPKDAVLVDFLEYAHFMPINNTTVRKAFSVQRLLAFVVRHEGPVERIDLGLLQPLNAVIQSWRESFGASARGAGAGKLLREKLWEPIEAKLGGAKIVLVSPDGALNRLPLAALPGKEAGRYLIEDYALAIVPTAQMIPELVQEGSGKPPPKNLLLMGNIDYDAAGAAVPDVPASPMMLASSRAAITTFGRLDATEAEVAQIAKLCPQDSTTGGVTTLQNSQASKAAFLAEGGRHRYLHLATHGFFIEEKLSVLPGSGPREPGRFGDLLQGPVAAEIHPALRCGLALAGANRAAKQSDVDPMSDKRDDNGILTAEEIGAQNLDGVQLVVLSACETGLGKSVAGEGVLGLQRSFQAAGARAVVASLWRVDDQATQTLMVEFYKNLWEKKLGKLGALRQAQLAMLHSYDRTAGQLRGPDFSKSEPLSAGSAPKKPATGGRQSLSPAYWAAFVLSGDWR